MPVPAQGWLEFRRETQYGDPDAPLDPEDVVAWLEWCRDSRIERSERIEGRRRGRPAGTRR